MDPDFNLSKISDFNLSKISDFNLSKISNFNLSKIRHNRKKKEGFSGKDLKPNDLKNKFSNNFKAV